MTTSPRNIQKRVTTCPSTNFVSCSSLPVKTHILEQNRMSNISGEGFWSTVAIGAARGVAGGVAGLAIGVGTAVIWHYYGDDIIDSIDETSRNLKALGDSIFDH